VRQYHLTFPLAGLVLLLVGLPFLMGQERGRGVERVAVGILICIAYFAVDFVARTLGITGQIGPIYAAWFPFVFFGSLGAVLYGTMRS
jgi:lipopolysaccharide export system permease protein